jgi:hypothetical protein
MQQVQTVMTGLGPAIDARDTTSTAAEKGVDHRVKPGDDDGLALGLPNLRQHVRNRPVVDSNRI